MVTQPDGEDWNPNHPLLKSTAAPHETAAVLRMQRAGYGGSAIMRILRVKGTVLMREIKRAVDDETIASRAGRPIHDAKIRKVL